MISRGKCVHGLTWMPRSPPQVAHQLAVDDAEIQAELVPHLVPPLDLERGRADDQDPPGPVADDQFQGDQARLDGLAEAHVVGNQQVDPRHLDGADHRVELVVFDVDARAERRLDVPHVGGGSGPPADGIEEGVEPVGGDRSRSALGRATFSMTSAPGSISQMTWSSSPRASSSTEARRRGAVAAPELGSSPGVGNALALTSLTTQRRDRT